MKKIIKKHIYIVLIMLLGLILFTSCRKDNLDNESKEVGNITIDYVKDNIKVGMNKEEMRGKFGKPSRIKSSKEIIEGYNSAEVWRYDFSDRGYDINNREMEIDVRELRKGNLKSQLFIKWSRDDDPIADSYYLFYFKDNDIYKYEVTEFKPIWEGKIKTYLTSQFIDYDKTVKKKDNNGEEDIDTKLPKFNGNVKLIKDEDKIYVSNEIWNEKIKKFSKNYKNNEYIRKLQISDFSYMKSFGGTLNNEDFQLDFYSLNSSYFLIVEKLGDEIMINLSSNMSLKPFVFYGESVNLMMGSKGINNTFNILTGEFENKYPHVLFESILSEILYLTKDLTENEYPNNFDVFGNKLEVINNTRFSFIVK